MRSFRLLFTIALMVCSLSCNSQGQAEQGKSNQLVILHTNDTHSQITPQTSGKQKGLGGYERREVYINKVRGEGKDLLLLDAGDFSQGTPYFTIFKGDVEIELMNALGYDAATLGNHEFDNGLEELARRCKNAEFDIICTNIDFTGTAMEGCTKPYAVYERGGKRIGVLGATTNLKGLVSEKNIEGIKWEHPYNILNKTALKLKNEQKCDLIILITHVGYNGGYEQNPADNMIAQNSENIDIIIGGHSHTYIKGEKVYKNKVGKDVIVVTAHESGNYVGRLDIEF